MDIESVIVGQPCANNWIEGKQKTKNAKMPPKERIVKLKFMVVLIKLRMPIECGADYSRWFLIILLMIGFQYQNVQILKQIGLGREDDKQILVNKELKAS